MVLRHVWRSYAAIVCLSKEQRSDLERFGIPAHLLHVLPFGIDTRYFAPAFRKDGEYILSVGKDLGRDYATLFAAAAEANLPLKVIAAQKNIPAGTHIPENVDLSYNLPLTQLREVYGRARFLVVASLPTGAAEGTDCSGQTVILEALAMGVPVLATRRPWLDEYFVEGEEYYGVPPQDTHALADALGRLDGDAGLRGRLGRAGCAKVRAQYSSEQFAGALLRLVRSVV
jgi:glycosyltransferase involved in cell wall biosynthesis